MEEDKIRNLRYRAEELRAIADGFKDANTAQALHRAADEYDRLAQQREGNLGQRDGEHVH